MKAQINSILPTKTFDSNIKYVEYSVDEISDMPTYAGDVIAEEKIAKQYADMILEEILKKNKNDFQVCEVGYDSHNGVWVICYFIDNETLGGGVNIAISRETGEVLNIWFGE